MVLVEHVIHDVMHVRSQVDLGTDQVDSLTDAGEARCKNFVARRREEPSHASPAVRAAPAAVDENERSHRERFARRAAPEPAIASAPHARHRTQRGRKPKHADHEAAMMSACDPNYVRSPNAFEQVCSSYRW